MATPHLRSRAALLLSGDLIALVAFAVAGRRSHDEATGLAAAGDVAETAAPFVLGWIAAMVFVRASRLEGVSSVGPMLRQTAAGWALAFPIAVALRVAILGRFSPWTFYVVAGLVAFALLAGWRSAFVLGRRRLAREAPAR